MLHDVTSLERATLAAVPPLAQEEGQGWLLAFDPGTVGRCHSAVPLAHAAPAPDTLAFIEGRYAANGLPAVLRVPDLPAFDALRAQLQQRGYARRKGTLVQIARGDDAASASSLAAEVELASAPDAAWEQMFLGPDSDAADAISRLAILRRGGDSLFASVRGTGPVIAVGCGSFGHGWCGIHGMRTAASERRQGWAGAIVAALARKARKRGILRAFLQVEEANEKAQSAYRRLGFVTAWRYGYWQQ